MGAHVRFVFNRAGFPRVGSNRLFQILDSYWRWAESGDVWYKSGIKSSFSIAVIYATRRRIPSGASANQASEKDVLILL